MYDNRNKLLLLLLLLLLYGSKHTKIIMRSEILLVFLIILISLQDTNKAHVSAPQNELNVFSNNLELYSITYHIKSKKILTI